MQLIVSRVPTDASPSGHERRVAQFARCRLFTLSLRAAEVVTLQGLRIDSKGLLSRTASAPSRVHRRPIIYGGSITLHCRLRRKIPAHCRLRWIIPAKRRFGRVITAGTTAATARIGRLKAMAEEAGRRGSRCRNEVWSQKRCHKDDPSHLVHSILLTS